MLDHPRQVAAAAAGVSVVLVCALMYHREVQRRRQQQASFRAKYARYLQKVPAIPLDADACGAASTGDPCGRPDETHCSVSSSSSPGTSVACSACASDMISPFGVNGRDGHAAPPPDVVTVIFGSATGNAEAHARSLVARLHGHGVAATLVDPATWEHLSRISSRRIAQPLVGRKASASTTHRGLEASGPGETLFGDQSVVIFVMATAGDGEAPENAVTLRREIQWAVEHARGSARGSRGPAAPPDAGGDGGGGGGGIFSHVHYAVLALGDTSYERFCRAGKELDAAMAAGGAWPLLPVTCIDASDALHDDAAAAWEGDVLAALARDVGIPRTAGLHGPPRPQCRMVRLHGVAPDPTPFPRPRFSQPPSQAHPVHMPILSVVPLTERRASDHSRIVRVEVGVAAGHLAAAYQPGDHLGMYPPNPPQVTRAYQRVLGISDADWKTTVQLCLDGSDSHAGAPRRNTLPARVSLSTVFEWYLDLCGKPRRSVLLGLAHLCLNPQERRAFLARLGPSDAACPLPAEAAPQCGAPASGEKLDTVLDYLQAFPSCVAGLTVGHFIELMPRIRPRFYSIASDSMTRPGVIQLYVRLVPGGLLSGFLERACHAQPRRDAGGPGDDCAPPSFVRHSILHSPYVSLAQPLVLIGAGTGVAPLIGMCHRREALCRANPTSPRGPCVLLLGFQNGSTEFFVRDELQRWDPGARLPHAAGGGGSSEPSRGEEPLISLLGLAFSRDQPQRRYVSHLIEEHGEYLAHLLTRSQGEKEAGVVCVVGDARNMARGVDAALAQILTRHAGLTPEAAAAFLQQMKRERRYLKDVY